jgi:hypothetical protein
MSAFLLTVLGGALAIAGGLGTAVWQTRRADDVARRIRQQERREQGLLALNSKLAEVMARLEYLHGVAQVTPFSGQYATAVKAIDELRYLWQSDLCTRVADPRVVASMTALDAEASERMPSGSDGMAHYAEETPRDKVVHFLDDLEHMVGLVKAVKTSVDGEIRALLS